MHSINLLKIDVIKSQKSNRLNTKYIPKHNDQITQVFFLLQTTFQCIIFREKSN